MPDSAIPLSPGCIAQSKHYRRHLSSKISTRRITSGEMGTIVLSCEQAVLGVLGAL